MYWAIFSMVTNKGTNEQLGDPRASLLVTSVRRQSFANRVKIQSQNKLVLICLQRYESSMNNNNSGSQLQNVKKTAKNRKQISQKQPCTCLQGTTTTDPNCRAAGENQS